jgi:hypothetical protein
VHDNSQAPSQGNQPFDVNAQATCGQECCGFHEKLPQSSLALLIEFCSVLKYRPTFVKEIDCHRLVVWQTSSWLI